MLLIFQPGAVLQCFDLCQGLIRHFLQLLGRLPGVGQNISCSLCDPCISGFLAGRAPQSKKQDNCLKPKQKYILFEDQ
jgi:hypothetical protein